MKPTIAGMNDAGIYGIRNILNGKIYVGSAVNMKKRFYMHKYHLRNGRHHSRYLQRAWNKYGQEMFQFCCLEGVDQEEELVKREQDLDYRA